MKIEIHPAMYFFGPFILITVLLIGVAVYVEMGFEDKTITVAVKEKIYQPSTEVLMFGRRETYYIVSEDSAGNIYKTETDYIGYGSLDEGDSIYLNIKVKKTR